MPTYGSWKPQSIDRAGSLQFFNRGTAWDYKRNGNPGWTNNGTTTVTLGSPVDASANWRMSAPYALYAGFQNARFYITQPLSSNLYSLNGFALSFWFKITTNSTSSGTPILVLGGPTSGTLTRGFFIQQLSSNTRTFFATAAGQTTVTISNPVGSWYHYLLTRDTDGNTNIYINDVSRAAGTYAMDSILSNDRLYVLSTAGSTGTVNAGTYITDLVMLRYDATTIPQFTLTGDAVYL